VGVNGSNAAPGGLVAAYSFSEGNGTTVTDSSGNNLTGTIVGATWTTGGRYGNALSFNGTSSYVRSGQSRALQLTGSMTLEAWVNAAANPADDGQIVRKSNGFCWLAIQNKSGHRPAHLWPCGIRKFQLCNAKVFDYSAFLEYLYSRRGRLQCHDWHHGHLRQRNVNDGF